METIIEIRELTKDYGEGRGIFDLSLDVFKGEMIGIVGPNGAGKTTTFRNIMGFLKPTSGKITIKGLDSWADSEKTKRYIGYVNSFHLKSGTAHKISGIFGSKGPVRKLSIEKLRLTPPLI